MATWGLHMMIVDKLYELGLSMDKKGFAVGNVAPDCNVENHDWTEFNPPRAVTHWMNTNSKLSADYEAFYNKYINGKEIKNWEESSFLFGYYSHLIVDVAFQKFVRDNDRVKNIYNRIESVAELKKKVKGKAKDFDTIKSSFGKQDIFLDIYVQEKNYLMENTNSTYNTILKNIKEFNHSLDFMPEGAIVRKLKIMTSEYDSAVNRTDFVFFSIKEINTFIDNTCQLIKNEFICKKIW